MKENNPLQKRISPQERARATRRRMLTSAHRLFVVQGYVPTTMDAIAAGAGVAMQTVKFTFHTKAELLLELIDLLAAGPDPDVPVMNRDWVDQVKAAATGRRLLALLVEHGSGIYERLAPLQDTIAQAAALDEQVAARAEAIRQSRRRGLTQFIDILAARDWLRSDLDPTTAVDILYALQHPSPFLIATRENGWTLTQWKAWQYQLLCTQLLEPVTGTPAPGTPDPTEGLTFGVPAA